MIDEVRVLQPLEDVKADLERLSDYETAADLAAALTAVQDAVEKVLRRLLRADPAAPEALRLSALSSADLPFPRVIEALRERDLIPIDVAGAVHELAQAAERAGSGQPRASDGDLAFSVIERVRSAVHAAGSRPLSAPATPAAATPLARAPRRVDWRSPRFLAIVGVVASLVLLILLYLALRGDERQAAGVAAFGAGRMGVAEQEFRAVLEEDADNVTAMLYLGRIYRQQGRFDESLRVLRGAAAHAPDDAAIRRELGHLLMSAGKPAEAATQYRRAVDLAPAVGSSWIGLVTAMRAAGDPRAETVLQRAPADARAALSR